MSLKKIRNLKNTLLFRLTVLYAGIFTLSSVIVFLFFYLKIQTVTMDNMDQELRNKIEKYSILMNDEGIAGVKSGIAAEAKDENSYEEFFRLVAFNGQILITTDTSSWGDINEYTNLAEIKSGKVDHVLQTLNIPEREFKARMVSAVIGPDAILQIGETFEDAENYLQIFRNWFFVLLIPIMLLSALLGWLMAKRALLDVEEVTKTAIDISNGSYDKRVYIKDRFDEIKRLGSTFNRMLDRIQTLLQSMREINDNIAHDLRSPLTRIRGIAEMSLMNERTLDDYKNMASSTMEECDSLIDMINTMLEITEIESGIHTVNIEELDLVKLISDACELFKPLSDEKNIGIDISLSEKLIFHGDKDKLQRIVSNLLENAIKYTPEGGNVSLSAVAANGKIEISFKDTGIGIAETALPHIFERFYRGDRSRSKDGVGLGLSLAKAFTEAMSGTISVISTVNEGSKFTITFPNTPHNSEIIKI